MIIIIDGCWLQFFKTLCRVKKSHQIPTSSTIAMLFMLNIFVADATAAENTSKPATPVEGAGDPQADLGLTDDVKVSDIVFGVDCLGTTEDVLFLSNSNAF